MVVVVQEQFTLKFQCLTKTLNSIIIQMEPLLGLCQDSIVLVVKLLSWTIVVQKVVDLLYVLDYQAQLQQQAQGFERAQTAGAQNGEL